MAGAREIRSKIRSTQNMRKVTSALQMVSASKVRRAQERMAASRPYARLMRQVIAHVAKAHSEYTHPLLESRETVRRVGYLVISSDRGFCGALNSNLFRRLLTEISDWRERGCEIEVVAIGQKAQAFFRRISGIKLTGSVTQLGDAPTLESLIGAARLMLKTYEEGKLDRVSLVYNRFVNAMQQLPQIEQLLPLDPQIGEEAADQLPQHAWDYLYEPEVDVVMPKVLTRYLESQIYQGVVENVASEHSARMVAMKAASDNAKKVIDNLTLSYNKARQAAITQEISEIVGGASVV